jgi:O-antigen ligase
LNPPLNALPLLSPPARQSGVLGAIGVATAALLLGAWKGALVAALALAVCGLVAYVTYAVAKGECDRIVVAWVLLFPLGYYFLSFPRERPVVQFDRTIVLVLFGAMLFASRSRTRPIPQDIKSAAVAWALFLTAAVVSLCRAANLLTAGRLLVDSFLCPAILGWYVLRQFRLAAHARVLHAAIAIISLYSAGIGIAEVLLQRDLLAFEASADYLAFDVNNPTGGIFLRANGPFGTNNSFALVGLISFFLLAFLWRVISNEAGAAHRTLHALGISAALLQALLPMFRSVLLTLIVVIVLDMFWSTGFRRMLPLFALGLVILSAAGLAAIAPGVFAERSGTENFYGRLAQHRQTLRIVADHPLLGIGMTNFARVVSSDVRYRAVSYAGFDAETTPHNNVAYLTVETGLVGALPYVASQVLLWVAFWRLRRRGGRGRMVWKYFVYIFLAYWISGMTLSSGYFGDLNHWFVFALCLLYAFGTQSDQSAAPLLSPTS